MPAFVGHFVPAAVGPVAAAGIHLGSGTFVAEAGSVQYSFDCRLGIQTVGPAVAYAAGGLVAAFEVAGLHTFPLALFDRNFGLAD